MMIEKISGISQINNLQRTQRSSSSESVKSSPDEISVSDEARKLSDAYYLNQVAEETPDVRTDLVEQIRQKIQDPNYLNDATIAATADKILSAFGL